MSWDLEREEKQSDFDVIEEARKLVLHSSKKKHKRRVVGTAATGGATNVTWEIFSHFDKDGSGVVDIHDLRELCIEFGHFLTDAELTSAMGELDEDGNGTIDYEEFVEWWHRPDRFAFLSLDPDALKLRHKAALLFHMFDEDGSGEIDREEFSRMHSYLQDIGMTRIEDIDHCMAELDEDGNGEVDFNEFITWVEGQTMRKAKLMFHK